MRKERKVVCLCVCVLRVCVFLYEVKVSDQEQLDRSWSSHATLSGPVLVLCDKKRRESKCFFLKITRQRPGLFSSVLVLRLFLHWFGIWK